MTLYEEQLAVLNSFADRLSRRGAALSNYDLQSIVLQLVLFQKVLLEREIQHMADQEETIYLRGFKLGKAFGRSFEVKDDAQAHRRVGMFIASQLGYKDLDWGEAFVDGFCAGLGDVLPQAIEAPKSA